ncbi:oxidoreductase alpha (molybdopterin) subunit [Sphingomonas gellani]|uniref:Oxidoreductase alpha (Molybdopterin) subunit n=1 Tax=Sphingomonas gellani TaxID=1166340 RepID=A0A1H7YAP3_9SPHN|nr:FdhF/YdeP family oxidoreductase [Sphingomonas gellani]SEM43025.1 oxidoreductase alpha (molybdopterin) subunit [Sphingomonas gellani]
MSGSKIPAEGEGPVEIKEYTGAAGGWGSMKSLTTILPEERIGTDALDALRRQNKPEGFMCVSCAWGKPAKPHIAEFCENGAKATAWEMTSFRVTPDFFQKHSVSELDQWPEHDLEQAGRLTHPMKYDAATDRYVAVSWADAFEGIGAAMKRSEAKKVVLYSSGRASLEASYMYALFARMWGQQNLPDSSNMCHETTSVGLKNAIGSPVATIQLEDYEKCDAIFAFGQNVGTNAPRMLHTLRDCAKRGVEIVTFNPLRERGWERFTDPQNPIEMATGKSTRISSQYHQVRAGGDISAILGICKLSIEADDAALAGGGERVLDQHFIDQHTVRFEEFAAFCRAAEWDDIVRESGLTRAAIEDAARVYINAKAVIAVYGMGITQHRFGMDSLYMLTNMLLLRGNIGRPGAGPGPVRGHSNVQGQRTVGITEKTELAPVDRLKALYQFDPPTEKGWDTVESCRAILSGECQGFVQLGGNFLRAIPDYGRMKEAWAKLPFTVHIATKLNKSHLVPGKESWILPCLGRSELDIQGSGRQAVSIEDSFSHIYGSIGKATPAADTLLSEPAIVAAIAKQVLPENSNVPWDAWVADYGKVRTAIENTYPDKFGNYNERLFQPGGFWKGNPASHRKWETKSGKAEFNVPRALNSSGFQDKDGRFRLVTLRSNDQFNTTIYGYDDRFRGIKGTRQVVMINVADQQRLGVKDGDIVALVSDADDGIERMVDGLRVTNYNLPDGTIAGYYPELNELIPLEHHALESHVPAGKSVPVRVRTGS